MNDRARAELQHLHELCIQNIIKAYDETLKHGELAKKVAASQEITEDRAMNDAKQLVIAEKLFAEFLHANKELAASSVKTYDTFASMMCSIGNVAVLLNLSLQARQPLTHLIGRPLLKDYVWDRGVRPLLRGISDRLHLTKSKSDKLSEQLTKHMEDLRDGNIKSPELNYSITYADEPNTLNIRLDIPASMKMNDNDIITANTHFKNAFIAWLEENGCALNEDDQIINRDRNIMSADDFHNLRYDDRHVDKFHEFLTQQHEMLNFHTYDPAPGQGLRP
jgi:hypothetical protein